MSSNAEVQTHKELILVKSKSEFSKRLREVMFAKHISTEELARRANMQMASISHLRAGDRNPHLSTIKRLAKAIPCELCDLTGQDAEPVQATPKPMLPEPDYDNPRVMKALMKMILTDYLFPLITVGKEIGLQITVTTTAKS